MATEEYYEERESRGGKMAPGQKVMGRGQGGGRSRRKVCRFCADQTISLDYKNPQLLRNFITERGKIIPRRITGNCAKHQRALAEMIKRSRQIALMPFTVIGKK